MEWNETEWNETEFLFPENDVADDILTVWFWALIQAYVENLCSKIVRPKGSISDLSGAPKSIPLKNLANFSRTMRYDIKFYPLITYLIIRKCGSFITLTTELTKLRCF